MELGQRLRKFSRGLPDGGMNETNAIRVVASGLSRLGFPLALQ
jgi:hypothetical protein